MLQGCLLIQYSYSRTWANYSTVQKPKIDHFTFLIFPTGYVLYVAPFYLHLDRPPHCKSQLYYYNNSNFYTTSSTCQYVHIINTRGFLFTAAAADFSPLRRRRHIYTEINLSRRFYTLDVGYLSLWERSLQDPLHQTETRRGAQEIEGRTHH